MSAFVMYSTHVLSLWNKPQEAKYTECWPGPPFDILLNKNFPAGLLSSR
jgi:hypothetical protein